MPTKALLAKCRSTDGGPTVRSEPVAAIDCGTNSTRLLISNGTDTLERRTTITALGEGLQRTGQLSPEAIERVAAALTEYKALIDHHQATQIRAVATSAARDASNAEDFFDRAEQILGVRPELLSGDAEARLSFDGATAELDPTKGPYLVVDIGGGSTEFAFGAARFESGISIDVGCVRLTEAYIESDPPLPEELVACLSITEVHLDDVVRLHPMMANATTMVGLAGTVTAAAAIEQGLQTYDRDAIHHFTLTKAAAEDVYRTVVTESLEDRVFNPGLESERAEVIVGGMCILVRIMRYFGFEECLVSESDILDGIVRTLIDGEHDEHAEAD